MALDERIAESLERRGIEYLVHYTRSENVESILEHGLLTRTILDDKGIRYVPSDTHRQDRYRESICLSVSFPNYRTLYSKRTGGRFLEDATGHVPDTHWCILFLDSAQVLGLPHCQFFPTNASEHSNWLNLEPPDGYGAFEQMFRPSEGHTRDAIPDSFTTDPQAEVQCGSNIPVSAIKSIVFCDQGEWVAAMRARRGWPLDGSPRTSIRFWSEQWLETETDTGWRMSNLGFSDLPFGPRLDYEEWRKETER